MQIWVLQGTYCTKFGYFYNTKPLVLRVYFLRLTLLNVATKKQFENFNELFSWKSPEKDIFLEQNVSNVIWALSDRNSLDL